MGIDASKINTSTTNLRTLEEIELHLQKLREIHNMPYYSINIASLDDSAQGACATFAGPWTNEELQGILKIFLGFDSNAKIVDMAEDPKRFSTQTRVGVCSQRLEVGFNMLYHCWGGWTHASLSALDFLESEDFELVSMGRIGSQRKGYPVCGSILLRKKKV